MREVKPRKAPPLRPTTTTGDSRGDETNALQVGGPTTAPVREFHSSQLRTLVKSFRVVTAPLAAVSTREPVARLFSHADPGNGSTIVIW